MAERKIEHLSLIKYLLNIGLWDNEIDTKYGFNLSPYPFDIGNYKTQFDEIGIEIVNFIQELNNIKFDPLNNLSKKESKIYRILKKAKNGYPFVQNNLVPPIIKVDIIVDENDNLQIVEIDGYNPRGFSYAIILNKIHEIKNNKIELTLVNEVKKRNTNTLVWLYPSRERYYLRSMEIFSKILKKEYNINVILVNADIDKIPEIDCCYLIAPWGLSKTNEVRMRDKVIELYELNPDKFIYPLQPWLNNKLLLAFPFLTEYKCLNKFIRETEGIKKFLPFTTINPSDKKLESKTYILKQGVSSGHKGVIFSNSKKFSEIKRKVQEQNNIDFIFQEEIKQKNVPLDYYQNGTTEKGTFYCRFIAHYNQNGKLLNVDLTARNEPLVYGSTDSIQTTCIYDS